MHLVAAARNHSRSDRFAGGLRNTDGQWNAYLSDRLLSLFMYVTMLRCVSDNIFSRSANYAQRKRSHTGVRESFGLEGMKTDTGSIFGK